MEDGVALERPDQTARGSVPLGYISGVSCGGGPEWP